MNTNEKDWIEYLNLIKFSYNTTTHLVTKESLFKVAYKVESLQSTHLAFKEIQSILEFSQDSNPK